MKTRKSSVLFPANEFMANLKRTREDILTSAIDLVHRRGLQSTGLKDLFAATHASSGSFYNYFQSKDEFAHALIDYQWQQIRENAFLAATSITEDPIQRLFWVIDKIEAKHLSEINCAGCLLGNLIVDLTAYNETFRQHLQQVFDEWHSFFAQMLRQGQEQLRDRVDPDLLAEQILTMLEGVLLISRLYDQPDRLKRGFSNIRQLITDSLKVF
ncbi:MAG: TetR/AcrR family transcriptional regulator [Pseudanabaena sp.]|jgi:TetR/AcrR family transcriptional repressor of nem operon|nr:TetR/AcrR family transcriptional regulator [Pseudanabaena sp. CoA8_M7]